MAEYAVIAVLVLLVAAAAFSGFGQKIVDAISRAGDAFGG
jgi:Flp pilus assembly pilin Flp